MIVPVMASVEHIRAAAFAKVRQLESFWGDAIPWAAINEGFDYDGQHMHLSGKARGIFRPRQMKRGVLSIKTTMPRVGRFKRYDDIASNAGYFEYRFMGDNPASLDNQGLRQSWEDQSPLIYFYAVAPTLYEAIYPVFVTEWLSEQLTVHVTLESTQESSDGSAEQLNPKRYSTIQAKARIHQAIFRQMVLSAYEGRCALSGLPLVQLLDAAHILPDRDERGIPTPVNGIAMSSIHHRAYDTNLLGIDADGIMRVSPSVANTDGGPLLTTLQRLDGTTIQLPSRRGDHPNRDFLEERFERFQKSFETSN